MKPAALSTAELAISILAAAGLCGALVIGYPITQHALWLLFLIVAFFYAAVRLIVRGNLAIPMFMVLFPLAALTLYHFFALQCVSALPLLIVTMAFAFFAFRFIDAIWMSSMILGVTSILVVKGQSRWMDVFWLVVSGAVWALFFWLQSHERESIRLRAETMERRARGFLHHSGHRPMERELPDLDLETQQAKAAASAFRMENVMNWVIDIIQEIMHPFSCFFFFMDQQEGNMRAIAYKSKSRFFDPDTVVEVNGDGILSWVVQHKQKMVYERMPKEQQKPEYYNYREKILSCIVYPVIIHKRVEGLLGMDARRSYSFGVDEEQLIELFARLTAELVEAFRNYQQMMTEADYKNAFYQAVREIIQTRLDLNARLDLLIKISNMLKKSDEIAIAVPKEDGSLVIRKTWGDYSPRLMGAVVHPESVCGQLAASGSEIACLSPEELAGDSKCLVSPGETKLKVNSVMLVMLPMQNNIRGVLIIGSRRRDYFTHADRYSFSTLAAQFGVAIENAIYLTKIRELAITDGLTGLYNHRCFQDFLLKDFKLAAREPQVFSLVIMDIDHFKKFNDTWGHPVGDEVLKHLARMLRELAREMDIVARYGGEEFVIIMRQCDLKAAVKSAERIRKTCEKTQLKVNDNLLSITISLGVASYPVHAQSPAELIAVADAALYSAKKNGRNRVEYAPDSGRQ
ncbi:GGDEF domain-containing protein [bacterium]|nr:GGDEF domain-containing protein [candidate division CSSED10-310 bacterium]